MNELIKHYGSQQALADAMSIFTKKKIRQSHVYYWIKVGLPPKRAIEIERMTNGLFSKKSICPKYYD